MVKISLCNMLASPVDGFVRVFHERWMSSCAKAVEDVHRSEQRSTNNRLVCATLVYTYIVFSRVLVHTRGNETASWRACSTDVTLPGTFAVVRLTLNTTPLSHVCAYWAAGTRTAEQAAMCRD